LAGRLSVAVVVLVLAGCGGGDGEAEPESQAPATTHQQGLPPAEYAERVDRLCARVIREVAPYRERARKAIARRGSERQQMARLADVLEDQLAVVTRFRKDEAVGLPSAHADDARRLVEKTIVAERELREAVVAFRAGEGKRAAEAMQRYAGLSLQTASVARDSELGFAICGAGA
jgi:hypothetical protein